MARPCGPGLIDSTGWQRWQGGWLASPEHEGVPRKGGRGGEVADCGRHGDRRGAAHWKQTDVAQGRRRRPGTRGWRRPHGLLRILPRQRPEDSVTAQARHQPPGARAREGRSPRRRRAREPRAPHVAGEPAPPLLGGGRGAGAVPRVRPVLPRRGGRGRGSAHRPDAGRAAPGEPPREGLLGRGRESRGGRCGAAHPLELQGVILPRGPPPTGAFRQPRVHAA
mmetsp:Transcript_72964/g.227375  ORF Transcript_72964/g.227375 Transcript_72964/m.227375 type:complete len:223 (+) Transcript_72964:180-848(+)